MCSAAPSLTERSLPAESTTVGATFATATVFESEPTLLLGSPSSAETETVTFAGPSGKLQSKLSAAAVSVLVPVPQDSLTVGFGSAHPIRDRVLGVRGALVRARIPGEHDRGSDVGDRDLEAGRADAAVLVGDSEGDGLGRRSSPRRCDSSARASRSWSSKRCRAGSRRPSRRRLPRGCPGPDRRRSQAWRSSRRPRWPPGRRARRASGSRSRPGRPRPTRSPCRWHRQSRRP